MTNGVFRGAGDDTGPVVKKNPNQPALRLGLDDVDPRRPALRLSSPQMTLQPRFLSSGPAVTLRHRVLHFCLRFDQSAKENFTLLKNWHTRMTQQARHSSSSLRRVALLPYSIPTTPSRTLQFMKGTSRIGQSKIVHRSRMSFTCISYIF